MKGLRDQIDHYFARVAGLLYRHPLKTLTLVLLVVAGFSVKLPLIAVDTSTEGLLHENDPALLKYHEFRNQFGRDQLLIIAIKSPEIFDPGFLETLAALHKDLEAKVPHVEEITSLINARNTRGENDRLIVEDLLADWPETPQALAAIKKRALDNPLFRNILISEDGSYTTIIIKTNNYAHQKTELDLTTFDSDDFLPSASHGENENQEQFFTEKENCETAEAVYNLVEKYQNQGLEIFISGSSAVTYSFSKSMIRDMAIFLSLSFIIITLILLAMFRRVSGVLFPLAIVILSLVSTIGIMAMCRVPIKMPTQVLPSFMIAVGVGYAVHVLALFYHHYEKDGRKQEAIVYAIGHSGLPVAMTAITTAGGLLSFVSAKVAPIADLGLFTSMGVLLALFYSFLLLPPLVAISPIKNKSAKRNPKSSLLTSMLEQLSRLTSKRPYAILTISSLMIVFCTAGLPRLRFSHDVIRWLPADDPLRMATETIDDKFRGSFNLEIIIDTGKENGLYDPHLLNRLEKTASAIESLEIGKVFAGKAWSLTSILKEINQALHQGDKQYYSVAQDKHLIAQQLLLFENSGSDDLEDVTDRQYSKVRLTVKVPLEDAIAYGPFIAAVNQMFQTAYEDATISVTGMIKLYAQTMTNTILSMARSYILSFVVITIIMILLIGQWRLGLVSMLPNLVPIAMTLGLMGWLGMPLSLFTIMIGSIAIGLSVDDTIHFMHNFRKFNTIYKDSHQAVKETLTTAGRAMLVTTCVLSTGFFIYMFARMQNFSDFGLLTGFTIIMALLADFFIAPSLMVIIYRNQRSKSPASSKSHETGSKPAVQPVA